MKYPQDFLNKIILGNNLEVLSFIPDNSIDTVISDPPYGLSNHSEKIIRKTLSEWLNGNENFIPNTKGFMGKSWDAFVPSPILWKEIYRVMKPGATALIFAGSRTQDLMALSMRLAGFEIKDTLMWLYSQGFPKSFNIGKKNLQWKGYGTALKPAYEPILLCIKPPEKNYTYNAEKWGVAGLNINNARIQYISEEDKNAGGRNKPTTSQKTMYGGKTYFSSKTKAQHSPAHKKGRFPSNVIFECTCDKVTIKPEKITQPTESKGGIWQKSEGKPAGPTYKGGQVIHTDPNCPAKMLDKQINNASRFFYCAKVLQKERTNHPTQKPLKLIEYLVKLTKMPNKNQIYLDPFVGSGTTCVAVKKQNRNYIGIEIDPDYHKIAIQRVSTAQQTSLFCE